MMKARAWIAVVAVVTLAGCLRFEPRPAAKMSAYSESAVEESVTMRHEDVHYSPAVLALGTPRERVFAAFGHPNADDRRRYDRGRLRVQPRRLEVRQSDGAPAQPGAGVLHRGHIGRRASRPPRAGREQADALSRALHAQRRH